MLGRWDINALQRQATVSLSFIKQYFLLLWPSPFNPSRYVATNLALHVLTLELTCTHSNRFLVAHSGMDQRSDASPAGWLNRVMHNLQPSQRAHLNAHYGSGWLRPEKAGIKCQAFCYHIAYCLLNSKMGLLHTGICPWASLVYKSVCKQRMLEISLEEFVSQNHSWVNDCLTCSDPMAKCLASH